MVQTRRKDDASFSRSTYLRRSTRETRVLRIEVSDKDDADFEPSISRWQLRARRHPSARIKYNDSLSHSLRSRGVEDSESEDEIQSDESIFNSRPRSAHRVSKSRRLSSADHAETSNDHLEEDMEEDLVHQEDDGVRRSTRRRSHPSWLIADQAVRGYPRYSQGKDPSSDKGRSLHATRSRDRLGANPSAEEASNRSGPSHQSPTVKHESKERAEDHADNYGSDLKDISKAEDGAEVAGNEENGVDSIAEEAVSQKVNPRRTKNRTGKESSRLDENFPDMYSRVKRVRRQTKRFSFPTDLPCGEMTSQTQSSSETDESDSDREQQTRRSSLRQNTRRTYSLRVNKPTVDRFQAHHEPVRRPPRALQKALCNSVLRHLGHRTKNRFAPDSSSSSSDEQARFDHKKSHSRHLPHNYHSKNPVKVGGPMHTKDGRPATLADIDPMALDTSIRFKDVGGLQEHIHCLQEMVVFPMLYKEVFEKFHITPPKGVLFHGPPGTGKTLIARALANECSQGDRKVSFFMRKGADCLSKWVGESERQLRLLFEQAYQMKPSIIFFDEIDGLAPVRSSKQDQIHASIVSTLLALMDGLDNRGEVIVIGATNRIDAIDPALRRPGRFDRELYFPLPACKERQDILRIHISKWDKKPEEEVLNELAEQSSGYCGSDLRALCSESVIQALRRTYPQIYKSSQRLLLDSNKVQVGVEDFALARSCIVPSAHRVTPSPARKLPAFLEPLLISSLESVISQLKEIFPHGLSRNKDIRSKVHRPRLLLVGNGPEQAQTTHLAPALLHHMEHIPVFTLDLGTMYEVSARSPEETVCQVFQEARRNPPSIVYLPGIGQWWDSIPHTVRDVFIMQLQKLDMNCPVLLLATSDGAIEDLSSELRNLFSNYRDEIFSLTNPRKEEREAFFRPLLLERTLKQPEPPALTEDQWEELPVAPPPEPAKLSEEELRKLYAKEEHTLRELRIFLREVCAKLARNRLFVMFTKPVDVEEAPDYYDIIEKPMDLETMMTRIDQHHYVCAKEFLDDIDLICRNALEYNPNRDQADKLIRHRACFLRDSAYALIKAEMDTDFEDLCRSISEDRKKRKDSPSRYAPVPEFIHTASSNNTRGPNANGAKEVTSRVNGDLSSHSSVASNNGALTSARKRRPSSWYRGCINKRKKKKICDDHASEKQDSHTGEVETKGSGCAPVSSPASPSNINCSTATLNHSTDGKETLEKSSNELLNFSHMNGNTHSDVEMQQISSPEPNLAESERQRQGRSPNSSNAKDTSKTRCTSFDCKQQETGKSPLQERVSKDEKKIFIDHHELEKLLTLAVTVTTDCNVEQLIELHVMLDKKICKFHNQWDRSSLPQILQHEMERYKAHFSHS